MLDSQATSAAIYKQLFTDSEWDAISSAMGDYSDYGNEEAMIADSIQAKIATIFRLTSNWFFILINIMLTKGLRGELLFLDQLTPFEAKRRMEDHKRWEQEHREELEVSSQQLFDDMFGGW